MPFALNEATRSISPTKTLEYLAAGLPVVSTRVPDVVADFPGVVHLRDDGAGFASLCRTLGQRDPSRGPKPKTRELLKKYHWDAIAAQMAESVFASGLQVPEPSDAEATA
jgi:glycosyltransferase involved in cell wall biosynthesis